LSRNEEEEEKKKLDGQVLSDIEIIKMAEGRKKSDKLIRDDRAV